MKYAMDSEFNGFGGDLISFALVPLHGEHKPLYVVIEHDPETVEPWVKQNILPVLGDTAPVSRETAARMLAAYLRLDSDPVVVADWPEDLAQLQMLAIIGPGKMVNMPPVTWRYEPCHGFDAAKYAEVPHNALEDAKALKDYMLDYGL